MKVNIKYEIIFLIILSLILTVLWTKPGHLLAGGEEGLSLYSPSRSLVHYLNPWYVLGGGYLTAAYIPRITLMAIGSLFELVFPTWIFQKVMFFSLFVTGMVGMYICMTHIYYKKYSGLITSIFYFGNLYSMSQIWMRFLYTGMFAWAIIPWILLFSVKFLSSGKKRYLTGMLSITLLGSNMYGIPSYIFTTWAPVCIYSLFLIFKSRQKFHVLVRLLILIFSWFLVHIWWIIPMTSLSDPSQIGISEQVRRNFSSLQGSSSFFPNSEIITLTQKYLFGKESPFFSFYNNRLIKMFEYLLVVVTIIGLIKLSKKKYFWILGIFAVGWFISKGTNPPFGEHFFSNIFKLIPSTMSLRNSYEKFGLVFVFSYSIYFGVGLSTIYKKSKLIATAIVILFFILSWPIWTGKLFISKIHVKVPDEYIHTNNTISKESVYDQAILHLPGILGEGVSYLWGYSGAEAAEYLFDNRSWSRQSGPDKFDQLYSEISNLAKNNKLTQEVLLNNNINFIVVHYDYTQNFNDQYGNPQEIYKFLLKQDWLKEIYSTQNLKAFILKNNKSELIRVSSGLEISRISSRRWVINNPKRIDGLIELRYSDNLCWKLYKKANNEIFKYLNGIYPQWEMRSSENMVFLECNIFPWEI